jgi:hypothetical protein
MPINRAYLKNNWEDYYQILGVDRNATPKKLKEARDYKSWLLKPERMQGVPEKHKISAEEELKRVNNAYDILKDPILRDDYNELWDEKNQSNNDNKEPIHTNNSTIKSQRIKVSPPFIYIGGAEAGEIKKSSFIIRNEGGHLDEQIDVNSFHPWIRIADRYRLYPNRKLPCKVDIELHGEEWDRTYHGDIVITLDDEAISVHVELKTKPEPRKEPKQESIGIEMPWIWQAFHIFIIWGGFYEIVLEIERVWHIYLNTLGKIILLTFWLVFYIMINIFLIKKNINLGFYEK